jgi:hypothetical protein
MAMLWDVLKLLWYIPWSHWKRSGENARTITNYWCFMVSYKDSFLYLLVLENRRSTVTINRKRFTGQVPVCNRFTGLRGKWE